MYTIGVCPFTGIDHRRKYFLLKKKYLHGYQSFLNLTLAFASGRVIIYLLFTPLARYTDSAVDNGDGTGSAVVNCCWNKLLDQV